MVKKSIFLYFIIAAIVSIQCYSQFDRKFSFNASAGTALPLGPRVNADSIPYVFTNFRNAIQVGFGGQYNMNSKLSFGLNLGALLAINYQNPIATPAGKEEIIKAEQANYNNSLLTNFSLGIDCKYKFFRMTKLNPYVFGEINFNSFTGEVAPRLQYYDQSKVNDPAFDEGSAVIKDKYTIIRYDSKKITTATAFGGNIGVGIDIKLSDTFTLYLQSAYNLILSGSNSDLKQNMSYVNFMTGLRFSLIKSKSIL